MSEYQYPGIRMAADGSTVVVSVETRICTGAAAYPITPATNMGVGFQQAVADGTENLWGERLVFFEPASVCEGYALAGGRVSNFTAGQGLILMKEVLYTIAGKRLPMVFNIAARALTVHALNVHAGHDDVMGVTDCGWGMIFARNAQEAGDFCLISRKTAEATHVPYLNIQDGFLTSHTVETVKLPEDDLIKAYMKPAKDSLFNFLDPANPMMTGTVQNQDAYMKGKIAQRSYYRAMKPALLKSMEEFGRLTGRKYGLIESYGMDDAEYAIVGMGSFMDTAKATVAWLRKNRGVKVGVVSVFSYRPFPAEELVEALKNVKVVSVLERLDDSNAPENPLARDIKAAFADALWGRPGFAKLSRMPIVQGGAGGLGGRDVRAADFVAIVENMELAANGKPAISQYCVGVKHPDALNSAEVSPDIRHKGTFSLRGHSVGGLGSVTTNKIMATVCGDLFGMHVQAFPKYGAEKKGLPTSYFLSVSPECVHYHQELEQVDFVILNDTHAFSHANPLEGLLPHGSIYIQGSEEQVQVLLKDLSTETRERMRALNLAVYYLDAAAIARKMASNADLQQRMQGIVLLGVFLKVAPFAAARKLTKAQLLDAVEGSLQKYFGKRGEKVVKDNLECVRRGFADVREVPKGWL
jgi:pyruvate-ferredoxin/flavodoxin oxidoreductase